MASTRINLDMDVLRSFATGLEFGSFAKASDRLGRSPSAVSAQLRKLEAQAGVALFRKSGRGIALTEAGEVMLGYARRLLELNDEAVAALRGAEVEGWVRLGLPQDFAEIWLPEVLGRFARAHPRVRVEARVERNDELIARVLAGRLDLVLVWGEAGAPYRERIATLPVVWIGPSEDRPLARGPGEPLPLIAFEPPCVFRSAGIEALDRAGISWRLAFTSPSLSGLWAAATAGLGVTVRTPAGLPPTLRMLDPAAAALPPLPPVDLSLLAAEAEPAPAARRLAAILKETLAALLAESRPHP
ncbi:MAG TPA: LysR substrate-binding domain-containing protein [Alphaproteobacteria bacterium]|nr:LysR substrate-binding domain-containing protein [Alphaproteobacteria bacterium]